MAKDLNKVMITGRLGKDPELRYTPQGSAVCSFSVASNRAWRDQAGATHEEAEWFRVVAWDKLGEVCNQYLAKGSRVYVEGRLQTRTWRDQDGQTRSTTEVVASDMIMLGDARPRASDAADDEEAIEPPPARPAAAPPPTPARAPGVGRSSAAPSVVRPGSYEDEDLPF